MRTRGGVLLQISSTRFERDHTSIPSRSLLVLLGAGEEASTPYSLEL